MKLSVSTDGVGTTSPKTNTFTQFKQNFFVIMTCVNKIICYNIIQKHKQLTYQKHRTILK